jgi:protein-S-isoprenylcysteine O-methyltransferase Ste14
MVGATAGLAIFVGLPLLSWGPGSARTFVDDPGRLAYLIVATLLTLVVAAAVPPPSRSRGVEDKVVHRQRVAVFLLQVLGLAIVVVSPWADRHEVLVLSSPGTRVFGVVLFALGHILMAWAQATLGDRFSIEVTIQKNHALVTKGLYHVVRHPRYLGMLMFTVGFTLVFRSELGLVLVLAETLVLLWRIHDEEELLRHEFAAEWDAYARASWRLLPFVY